MLKVDKADILRYLDGMRQFLLCILVWASYAGTAFSAECIATPPGNSVDSTSPSVRDYQSTYLDDLQINAETFVLPGVGEVLVMFESCDHLVWTVVILPEERFHPEKPEEARYFDLLQSLRKIPFRENSRFEELLHALRNWRDFPLREQAITDSSYYSWRKEKESFSDLLLRESALGAKSKIRIDLNKAL